MNARVLIPCAMVCVMAASTAAQHAKVREHDPDWSAPSTAAEKTNPLLNRPETEAGGRKLFHQRCSTCHGDDAGGTSRGPDLTAPDVQAQSDGELFWKITSGNTRTGMPTFSFLPELQRWQLVLHIRRHGQSSAVRQSEQQRPYGKLTRTSDSLGE